MFGRPFRAESWVLFVYFRLRFEFGLDADLRKAEPAPFPRAALIRIRMKEGEGDTLETHLRRCSVLGLSRC